MKIADIYAALLEDRELTVDPDGDVPSRGYAVSVNAGEPLTVPATADEAAFAAAWKAARKRFAGASYLTITRDHRVIAFDPVQVVRTTREADILATVYPVPEGARSLSGGAPYYPPQF